MKRTRQLITCMLCAVFATAEACADASSLDKFIDYRANGNNGVFILNTNCWAYGIDTSCVSMWNSATGNERAGTAISKRHLLAAVHHPLGVGWTMYFCGTNGVIYMNRVAGTRNVAGTDIQIASLQSELPDAVTPALLFPTNFHEYVANGRYLPTLQFDQDERCLISEISDGLPSVGSSHVGEASFATSMPHMESRRPWYAHVRDKDSGNPIFLVIGNNVVLLGAIHSGNGTVTTNVYRGGCCPFVTCYTKEIQAAMDALTPGYFLSFVDLSPYDKQRRTR